MKVTIYKLFGADGKAMYVGSTALEGGEQERLKTHRKNAGSGNPSPVYVWMRKVGIDFVEADALEVVDAENRWQREAHWMSVLKTLVSHGGCNEMIGNKPGSEAHERTRAHWSVEANRKQLSEAVAESWNEPGRREAAAARLRREHADPARKALTSYATRKAGHVSQHVRRARSSVNCAFCRGEEI